LGAADKVKSYGAFMFVHIHIVFCFRVVLSFLLWCWLHVSLPVCLFVWLSTLELFESWCGPYIFNWSVIPVPFSSILLKCVYSYVILYAITCEALGIIIFVWLLIVWLCDLWWVRCCAQWYTMFDVNVSNSSSWEILNNVYF